MAPGSFSDLARSRLAARLSDAYRTPAISRKAISFGLIGVVNTAVDYGVFLIARAAYAHLPPALALSGWASDACGCGSPESILLIGANITSWLIAVTGSYIMNSSFTFAAESGRQLRWRVYFTFVLSGIAGLIANTAALVFAAQILLLPIWVAKAVAILASFIANFSLSHFVVFRVPGWCADDGPPMPASWLAFWDSPHPIYVGSRHKDMHYRLIARDIADLIVRKAPSAARVLDYGSGEALHSDIVATVVGELLLCEAAPSMRAALAARFAGKPKIRVIAPEDATALGAHVLDVIVLHSVVQYLTPDEVAALFVRLYHSLKSSGILVVSDVIAPDVSALTDVLALLRFGAGNGFLLAALSGLIRLRLSHYWRLRTRIGVTRYSEAAMIEKLGAAGFVAERSSKNIGHSQARMAFLARPLYRFRESG
jgi:putative flippase GtrA/SAM-dependent methyltransferase